MKRIFYDRTIENLKVHIEKLSGSDLMDGAVLEVIREVESLDNWVEENPKPKDTEGQKFRKHIIRGVIVRLTELQGQLDDLAVEYEEDPFTCNGELARIKKEFTVNLLW